MPNLGEITGTILLHYDDAALLRELERAEAQATGKVRIKPTLDVTEVRSGLAKLTDALLVPVKLDATALQRELDQMTQKGTTTLNIRMEGTDRLIAALNEVAGRLDSFVGRQKIVIQETQRVDGALSAAARGVGTLSNMYSRGAVGMDEFKSKSAALKLVLTGVTEAEGFLSKEAAIAEKALKALAAAEGATGASSPAANRFKVEAAAAREASQSINTYRIAWQSEAVNDVTAAAEMAKREQRIRSTIVALEAEKTALMDLGVPEQAQMKRIQELTQLLNNYSQQLRVAVSVQNSINGTITKGSLAAGVAAGVQDLRATVRGLADETTRLQNAEQAGLITKRELAAALASQQAVMRNSLGMIQTEIVALRNLGVLDVQQTERLAQLAQAQNGYTAALARTVGAQQAAAAAQRASVGGALGVRGAGGMNNAAIAASFVSPELGMAAMAATMGPVVAGAAAVAGLVHTLGDGVDKAGQFTKQLSQVKALSGESATEINRFGQYVRTLSTKLPVASKDLIELGRQAVLVGLHGSEGIKTYTTNMAALSVVLRDVNGHAAGLEHVGQEIVKVLRSTGATTAEVNAGFGRMVNGLVALKTESGVAIPEVTNLLKFWSSQGAHVGLTIEQMTALSAALIQTGARAQGAGGALSTFFQRAAQAAAEGGPKLEAWGKIMHMTGDEAAALLKQNPMEFLRRFVTGANELDDKGQALSLSLGNVNLKSQQVQRTFAELALAMPLVAKNTDVMTKGSNDSTLAMRKAQEAAANYKDQVQTMSNAWTAFKTNLGMSVMPFLSDFVTKVLSPMAQSLMEFSQSLQNLKSPGELWAKLTIYPGDDGTTRVLKFLMLPVAVGRSVSQFNNVDRLQDALVRGGLMPNPKTPGEAIAQYKEIAENFEKYLKMAQDADLKIRENLGKPLPANLVAPSAREAYNLMNPATTFAPKPDATAASLFAGLGLAGRKILNDFGVSGKDYHHDGAVRADAVHNGIDLKAPRGTPIFSPFAGAVSFRKDDANGKVFDLIDAAGNRLTGIHLDAFDEGIQKALAAGAKKVLVLRGQKLGTVGNTGTTAGSVPHLHLMGYLAGSNTPVDARSIPFVGGPAPVGGGHGALPDRAAQQAAWEAEAKKLYSNLLATKASGHADSQIIAAADAFKKAHQSIWKKVVEDAKVAAKELKSAGVSPADYDKFAAAAGRMAALQARTRVGGKIQSQADNQIDAWIKASGGDNGVVKKIFDYEVAALAQAKKGTDDYVASTAELNKYRGEALAIVIRKAAAEKSSSDEVKRQSAREIHDFTENSRVRASVLKIVEEGYKRQQELNKSRAAAEADIEKNLQARHVEVAQQRLEDLKQLQADELAQEGLTAAQREQIVKRTSPGILAATRAVNAELRRQKDEEAEAYRNSEQAKALTSKQVDAEVARQKGVNQANEKRNNDRVESEQRQALKTAGQQRLQQQREFASAAKALDISVMESRAARIKTLNDAEIKAADGNLQKQLALTKKYSQEEAERALAIADAKRKKTIQDAIDKKDPNLGRITVDANAAFERDRVSIETTRREAVATAQKALDDKTLETTKQVQKQLTALTLSEAQDRVQGEQQALDVLAQNRTKALDQAKGDAEKQLAVTRNYAARELEIRKRLADAQLILDKRQAESTLAEALASIPKGASQADRDRLTKGYKADYTRDISRAYTAQAASVGKAQAETDQQVTDVVDKQGESVQALTKRYRELTDSVSKQIQEGKFDDEARRQALQSFNDLTHESDKLGLTQTKLVASIRGTTYALIDQGVAAAQMIQASRERIQQIKDESDAEQAAADDTNTTITYLGGMLGELVAQGLDPRDSGYVKLLQEIVQKGGEAGKAAQFVLDNLDRLESDMGGNSLGAIAYRGKQAIQDAQDRNNQEINPEDLSLPQAQANEVAGRVMDEVFNQPETLDGKLKAGLAAIASEAFSDMGSEGRDAFWEQFGKVLDDLDAAHRHEANQLEVRKTLRLVSDRDYLDQKEKLDAQAVEDQFTRETAGLSELDDAYIKAAREREEKLDTIHAQARAGREQLDLQKTRALEDVDSGKVRSELEDRYARHLVTQREYLNQKEALDRHDALITYNRAIADHKDGEVAWAEYQATLTRIREQGKTDREKLNDEESRSLENTAAGKARSTLEDQNARHLISQRAYLDRKEELDRQDAERTYERALKDGKSQTVAAAEREATLTRIREQGITDRQNLDQADARGLEDVAAGKARATLEDQNARHLISQRAYLERKEELDRQDAERTYQRAIQDGKSQTVAAAEREATLTRIREQGITDRAALERDDTRALEDISSKEAYAALEDQQSRGLINQREYLSQKEELDKAAAVRAYDQAIADGKSSAVAKAEYEATLTRIKEKGITDRAALDKQEGRNLQDAVTSGKMAGLEWQHDQGLIADEKYLEQKETLEREAAARALQQVKDDHGDVATAEQVYQNEMARITREGTATRRSIEEQHADFQVQQAQRTLEKSFGAKGREQLISGLETKVRLAREGMKGLVEGTDAYAAALTKLQAAQDALSDAKLAPGVLATWQKQVQDLGTAFEKHEITAEQFTAGLHKNADGLREMARQAEAAGNPALAKQFRDLAASLHAMDPKVAALLQKFGKLQEVLGYVQEVAGAFDSFAGAMGAAEEEYDSLTGAKLQTPWKDLEANLNGAANAAGKLLALAGDVAKIIANPADVGAWVEAITKVVSGIAEAIGGFKKAQAEVRRLKQEFQEQNPLLHAEDYQKTFTRSRGWLADIFGGGPEVVNEIDKLGLKVAQTIASGVMNGMQNGFQKALEANDFSLFAKTLSASIRESVKQTMIDSFLNDPARQNTYAAAIKGYTDALKTGDPTQVAQAYAVLMAAYKGDLAEAKKLFEALKKLEDDALTPEERAAKAAAKQRDLDARGMNNEETALKIQLAGKLISQEDYDKKVLALTLRRLDLEMAEALAVEGLTEEQKALIREEYRLKRKLAEEEAAQQTRERELALARDLAQRKLDLEGSDLDLQQKKALLLAKTDEERTRITEGFERKRLALTLKRLKAEMEAELAGTELTEEQKDLIRQKYDLAAKNAQADFDTLVKENADKVREAAEAARKEQQETAKAAAYAAEQARESWRGSLGGGIDTFLNGGNSLDALTKGIRDRIQQGIREGLVAKRFMKQLDPLFDELQDRLTKGLSPDDVLRRIAAQVPALDVQLNGTLGPLRDLFNTLFPPLTDAIKDNTAARREEEFGTTVVSLNQLVAPEGNLPAELAFFRP
ncbi:peptidoglycan DD-metalloendopeptidase family protein [Deinococcus hopiensis]|uniref:Murein DD-endopeptidase MepM and murein hydrolase activator NlpD, contain LysM domain n=1 Tax=Deinococcus hopiensis KR-140 TaxID=695939 RepID=A0A1W1UXN8_9DEIO|nr:peptidoglycan DD-metalloendopeptidase family protein [Deinococcus hopiensis]SMB85770.1 Murein DD-endopeptidase MepM and murein hydrolase activator NlpD, contain LysM domain [Deinococcus hopiensis KR-140]